MSDVKSVAIHDEEVIHPANNELLPLHIKKEDCQYEIQSLSAAFQSICDDGVNQMSASDPHLKLKVGINTINRIKKEPCWDEYDDKGDIQQNTSYDNIGKQQDAVTANQQQKSIFDILKIDASTMTDENPTFPVNVKIERDFSSEVAKLKGDCVFKSEESIGSLSAVYDMECTDEMTKSSVDSLKRRFDVTLPKTEDVKKEPELDLKDKNRIAELNRACVSIDGNLEVDLVESSWKKLKQDLAKDASHRNSLIKEDSSKNLPPKPAATVALTPISLSAKSSPLFPPANTLNKATNTITPDVTERMSYQSMAPALKYRTFGACFPIIQNQDEHAAIHTTDTNGLSSMVMVAGSLGTSTSKLNPKAMPLLGPIGSLNPTVTVRKNIKPCSTPLCKNFVLKNDELQQSLFYKPFLSKQWHNKYAKFLKKKTCDKKYTCVKCGKVFSDSRTKRAHRKVHERVTCSVCNASICNSTTLQVHMRIHTGELPHQCNQCDARFRYVSTYKVHLATHLETKPYVCEICNARFGVPGKLKSHKVSHTDYKPYECHLCDSKFRTNVGLKSHQSAHSDERPFNCETCSQDFKTKSGLRIHRLKHTHKKDFSCDSCNAKYYFKSQLETHKKTHLKENRFKCSKCEKSFSKKHAYKRHERVHTGERPFKCKICNAAFKYDPNLLYHLKTHTDSKPFVCDTCGMGFKLKHHLKNHQQTHISGKTFGCTVCGKRLKSMRSFKRHQLSHTEDGPRCGSNQKDTEEDWSSNSDEEDTEAEWSANSDEEETEEVSSANSDDEDTEEDRIGSSHEKSKEEVGADDD